MPAVAANTPSLKFSVGRIIFDLYANKRENKIPSVNIIAVGTISGAKALAYNLDIKEAWCFD